MKALDEYILNGAVCVITEESIFLQTKPKGVNHSNDLLSVRTSDGNIFVIAKAHCYCIFKKLFEQKSCQ